MANEFWQPIDWSVLGKLPQAYYQGQASRAEQEARDREGALRQQLQGGMPRGPDGQIDWNKAVDLAARTGNIGNIGQLGTTVVIAKQAEEQAALDKLGKVLGGFGSGAVEPPVPAVEPPVPAVEPPAPPGAGTSVAPGTVPGVEPPATVASAPPSPLGVPSTVPANIAANIPPSSPVRLAGLGGAGMGAPSPQPPAVPPQQYAQAGTPAARPATPAVRLPQPPAATPDVRQQAIQMQRQANPFASEIAKVMAIVPRLPPNTQQTMATMLREMFKGNELTNDQKEWIGTVLYGGNTEDFKTFSRLKRAAEAGVLTSAEGIAAKQHEARMTVDTETMKELSKKVASAQSILPVLERVKQLAHETPEGFWGGLAPLAQRFASAFGIPWQGGVNAELFNALTRQMIPGVRDPGSTSNLELSSYTGAVPSLSNSAEGRIVIANMMQAQIERVQRVWQVYRDHAGSPELGKHLDALENKPLLSKADQKRFENVTGHSPAPPVPGAELYDNPQTPGKKSWFLPPNESSGGKWRLVR
jgi:hypothetical protein